MPKRTFTPITSAQVLNWIEGRPLLDPPILRQTWCNSRLVVQEDGSPIPLLHLIAERKFGPWDPRTHYPVWCDKDWTNESEDNVKLVEKFAQGSVQRNTTGHPAGSPGYHKAYRALHPEKVKEWSATNSARRKADRAEMRALKEENKALRNAAIDEKVRAAREHGRADPEHEARLARELEEILGLGRPEASPED